MVRGLLIREEGSAGSLVREGVSFESDILKALSAPPAACVHARASARTRERMNAREPAHRYWHARDVRIDTQCTRARIVQGTAHAVRR